MTTKTIILGSLATALGLLLVGASSLALDGAPAAQMILLPGVLADYKLAELYSPATIGLGGGWGLPVVLTASGVFWFALTFVATCVGRALFARTTSKKHRPDRTSEPIHP